MHQPYIRAVHLACKAKIEAKLVKLDWRRGTRIIATTYGNRSVTYSSIRSHLSPLKPSVSTLL